MENGKLNELLLEKFHRHIQGVHYPIPIDDFSPSSIVIELKNYTGKRLAFTGFYHPYLQEVVDAEKILKQGICKKMEIASQLALKTDNDLRFMIDVEFEDKTQIYEDDGYVENYLLITASLKSEDTSIVERGFANIHDDDASNKFIADTQESLIVYIIQSVRNMAKWYEVALSMESKIRDGKR